MTDWADDEASRLDSEAFICGGGGDFPSCSVNQALVAKALRKAKADGFEEGLIAMQNAMGDLMPDSEGEAKLARNMIQRVAEIEGKTDGQQ